MFDDRSWLLTLSIHFSKNSAAHCKGVFRRGVYVNTTRLGDNGIFASVQGEYAHPDYDDFSISNDFMIVRLNRDIQGVPVIALNLDAETSPTGGETMEVMGFGRTQFEGSISSQLKKTSLRAVSHTSCAQSYRNVNRIDRDIMLWYVS